MSRDVLMSPNMLKKFRENCIPYGIYFDGSSLIIASLISMETTMFVGRNLSCVIGVRAALMPTALRGVPNV